MKSLANNVPLLAGTLFTAAVKLLPMKRLVCEHWDRTVMQRSRVSIPVWTVAVTLIFISVTYLNKTHSDSEESLKLELELLNKRNIRSVNLIFVVLHKKSNVNIKALKLISVPDSFLGM